MPTLNEHRSSDYTKIIFIGDSGTGKTGALASLLQDGYSMKIIDMDNGLEPLVQYGRKAGCDLSKVEFATFRDPYKAGPGGATVKGQPKAFMNAMEKLTEWTETDDSNCVIVIDSLDMLGKAALAWAKHMNPTSTSGRKAFGQTWYFTAQQLCEAILALITGDEVKANVIVISHVKYVGGDDDNGGTRKGYPAVIGSALSPSVADYFNTLILAESSGSGTNVRRRIKTMPTGVIDLKLPIPEADKEYPLETGLSTIFKALKGKS